MISLPSCSICFFIIEILSTDNSQTSLSFVSKKQSACYWKAIFSDATYIWFSWGENPIKMGCSRVDV